MSKGHKVRDALVAEIDRVPRRGSPPAIYDPPRRGFLTVWHDETPRVYGVQVDAEMNGVWIVSHRRISGRWDREQRARHIGQADAHDDTQTGDRHV